MKLRAYLDKSRHLMWLPLDHISLTDNTNKLDSKPMVFFIYWN